MPENEIERKVYSLMEVTQSIQRTILQRYQSSFWVKAEMNKLNFYKHSGHCYPELVEKREGKVIAQMKACLWREDFVRVNENFQSVLHEPLKDGIKILFLAKVLFDPAYGLSLSILEIDPAYTLGDLEREKQETIRALQSENIFSRNRLLKLPMLPQRIAIISVETSKGLADFNRVLEENPWGYKFFTVLFPSLLQGDQAVAAIRYQLKRIKKVIHHFDVVAIIRGGGGEIGLSCYNHLLLAKDIALFPIPVISGIGHATNETVAEMVSNYNAITPTKLADFLLHVFHDFSRPVMDAEKRVVRKAEQVVANARKDLGAEVKSLRNVTANILDRNRKEIFGYSKSLKQNVVHLSRARKQEIAEVYAALVREAKEMITSSKLDVRDRVRALENKAILKFDRAKLQLDAIENNINNMNPERVLRRGYSITTANGKVVRDLRDVEPGVVLTTTLANGKVVSIVESKQESDE
jgi:exodeoxyribonuclease VII large subunit